MESYLQMALPPLLLMDLETALKANMENAKQFEIQVSVLDSFSVVDVGAHSTAD